MEHMIQDTKQHRKFKRRRTDNAMINRIIGKKINYDLEDEQLDWQLSNTTNPQK